MGGGGVDGRRRRRKGMVKCRGNEEIKIRRRKYRGKGGHRKKNPKTPF